jgi:hypothetical protein
MGARVTRVNQAGMEGEKRKLSSKTNIKSEDEEN